MTWARSPRRATGERFVDRRDAGRRLGELVARLDLSRPLVLGLPRGGVPVGQEVALRLGAPLEVFVARKLGAPGQPELGIGAIAEGGARVVNELAVRALRVSVDELEAITERETRELDRRVDLYRAGRPLPEVDGRDVVLVDDGLATGVTAEASMVALRELGPGRLILAVPACAPDTVDRLAHLADEVVYVIAPPSFHAVGAWYDRFDPTSDDEVREVLADSMRTAP